VSPDRTGKRAYVDDAVIDVGDLCDGAGGTRPDDDPCAYFDERSVAGVADWCPRHAGVVFSVEIDA